MEFDRGIVNQMTGRVGTLQKKGFKSSILSELIFFTLQFWQMRMNSTQQSVILIDLEKTKCIIMQKVNVNRLKKGKIRQLFHGSLSIYKKLLLYVED
jgi:hypothetical protein